MISADGQIRAIAVTVLGLLVAGTASAAVYALTDFGKPVGFRPADWKPGDDEWEVLNVPTGVRDWSAYDRLVVDVISRGNDPTHRLGLYVARETGSPVLGLAAEKIPLPARNLFRWTVPLVRWPATMSPKDVGRIHLCVRKPHDVDVQVRTFALLRPNESVPDFPADVLKRSVAEFLKPRVETLATKGLLPQDCVQDLRAGIAVLADYESYRQLDGRIAESERRAAHEGAYRQFRRTSASNFYSTDGLLVGMVSSMKRIRPRGTDVPLAIGREGLSVRLAKNESEAVQVVVAADEEDLTDVQVAVSKLQNDGQELFPRNGIVCPPVGSVRTEQPPYLVAACERKGARYQTRLVRPEVGWWPDPILEETGKVSVSGRDFQCFWVRVTCPPDVSAGTYRGQLAVVARGRSSGRRRVAKVPFAVRVNGFALPSDPVLPLVIRFQPAPDITGRSADVLARAARLRADVESPVRVWRNRKDEWKRFWRRYGIRPTDIYAEPTDFAVPEGDAPYNLGYWSAPADLSDAARDKWRQDVLEPLVSAYRLAEDAGAATRAFCYGCDEAPLETFAAVDWAAAELKRALPKLPLMTTAADDTFGQSGALANVDWFVPLADKYDLRKVAAARAVGRQVWWYVCSQPPTPYPNLFTESRAIEARILMGAAAARMRPDGFLYYQTAKWNAERPISGDSAFCEWNPRTWRDYNGDGSLAYCGTGGVPLPSIRLENFRDGLEDLAYVRLLERAVAAEPDARWAKEARTLLAVPEMVMETLENVSDDPQALLAWRNRMADLLEAAQTRDFIKERK